MLDNDELIATRKLHGQDDGLYEDNPIEKDREMTIGEIIDNLMENPALVIKKFSKLLEDCRKVNEDLQLELKNKQSEIDFLKGQLSVYKKFYNREEEE